ncbi:unnamed protein product [Paramecium primaurelia]|uniref:Uncharacterized protein n=1 Tax=Paramecium primaurelia TaxID=5886 RepID=A0A8S1MYS5_PARPR|nr:unnamed protein product [Paramecium primaurelia]
MLQEAYYICVSTKCQKERILKNWESIVAHQNEGHEVIQKEDLINTINVKLNKKKTTLLQDLLARIHKIMNNQEDVLISLINQKFFESYTNWKEQIQSFQQFQDYLLPNQIDENTTISKLIDIYQNLDNEQLHFFKDCLYQTEQQYNALQIQIKMSLNKTDEQFKMLQQSLFNQIQENKKQRELKLQYHQNNNNKIQIINFQNTQSETVPIQQKDIIIKNTIDFQNTFKDIQLKTDFQNEQETLILQEINQQREQHQKNHNDRQENGYNLTTNNNNNKLNEKSQKYIVLTKQKEFRNNQHFEQYSNNKQNSEDLIQSLKLQSDTQYIKKSENNIQDNKQLTDIITEIKILPLKGYKDHQQQQNIIQNINSKDQIEQSQTTVNQIVHQSSMSPSKPPPLKGYKDRQNEEQKNIKLTRSNDKRNYLDIDQIKEISQNTSKRFDIDKSEKHMKYSNKFSTIFSIKECFAVVDGVFKLTDNHQFHIYLRSSVESYEIETGMINLTQIKQKNTFPSIYGINERGECLSNQTKTPIKLNLNQSYLFAYRKDEKHLICLDSMNNIQYAIQLQNDENSDYVFFIKMSNLEVQLI